MSSTNEEFDVAYAQLDAMFATLRKRSPGAAEMMITGVVQGVTGVTLEEVISLRDTELVKKISATLADSPLVQVDDDEDDEDDGNQEEEDGDVLEDSDAEAEEEFAAFMARKRKGKGIVAKPAAKRGGKRAAAPKAKQRQGPLGGYSCMYDPKSAKTKEPASASAASSSSASTQPADDGDGAVGIDQSVIDKLRGPQQRFARIWMLAKRGSTEHERAQAQAKLDKKLADDKAEGYDEIIAAYNTLQSGGSAEVSMARPGLQICRIYQNGEAANIRQTWMLNLASFIATQYLVAYCPYSHPVCIGFFGDNDGATAAALQYEELFKFICELAPSHGFAQGFADEWGVLIHMIKNAAKRKAKQETEAAGGTASGTALVLVDKEALIKLAKEELFPGVTWRKARRAQGADRTSVDYEAGRAAARSKHGDDKISKTKKLT
jgi:hypothetical protein